MKTYDFGTPDAPILLVQPVDDHDLAVIENEVAVIRELTGAAFRLVAFKVEDWNRDLSPWEAPPVFGSEGFGDGAPALLEEILRFCAEARDTYEACYIGGYSLAGLFALWAAYQTDAFDGVAAASPSLWFPGFPDYMETSEIKTSAVYLSLGDKEEKARNPVMATVGDCIREARSLLERRGVRCTLEWNPGNHFRDPDRRTAKAFAWLINVVANTFIM